MNRWAIRNTAPNTVMAGLLGGALALLPAVALAQDNVAPRLTFGLVLGVENDSNPDLDPVSTGTRTRATARLSFGYAAETPISLLTLNGSTRLVSSDGSEATGVIDPTITLSYRRAVANASLTLDATLRETDLTETDIIDEFDTGSGYRTFASLRAGLTWGDAAPVGYGLNAEVSGQRYRDTSDPSLQDSQTFRLGGNLRFDLSEVSRLTLSLTGSRYDDGEDIRDTLGFGAGYVVDRPLGPVTFDLTVNETEDGTRSGLRLGQSRALAGGGQVEFSLGATRSVDGDIFATGRLVYAQPFPTAQLTANLTRDVVAGSDDTERVISRASLAYRQDLTPLSSVSLTLDWAESLTTEDDATTSNSSIAARYSYALTEDWALDVGYRHRLRDEDDLGRAESNAVFLELKRDFVLLK